MPFSATVNLGTVGVAITSVKLYGCTGTSGGSCTGCTALTGYENVSVSTFPLLVNGIPNGVTYIQAEALGACSADLVKQCISISGIPGATPAPTSTPTPTPTGTSAPGATPNPTSTPTPTPSPSVTDGSTPQPTQTMTPTPSSTGEVQITNCVRLVKDDAINDTECAFNRTQRHEVTLYDPTGANIQVATYDITVTLSGTEANEQTTWDLIIETGQSSAYEDILVRETVVCGNRDGMIIRYVSGISEISPTNIDVCDPVPLPTGGVTLNDFFRGQGLSNSIDHCGDNWIINSSFFSTATTISGLMNQTIYTTIDGTTAFNGLGLWYPIALETGTNTLSGLYYVIKINSNGSVEDIVYISSGCGDDVPL